MRKLVVSLICAAMLAAPVLAGGDCCKKTEQANANKPACCASKTTEAAKGGSCPKAGAQAKTGAEKSSCCAGEKASTASKACQTCESQSWMMAKPNPNCKGCQTASL